MKPKKTKEELIRELKKKIELTMDRNLHVVYYPCSVKLYDGRTLDCVYFIDKREYIDVWGDAPKSRHFVDVSEIESIHESKYRLPKEFAEKIYEKGQSFYSGVKFVLVMRDGKRLYYMTGGAIDFIELPEGYIINDIKDAIHSFDMPRDTDWDLFEKGYKNKKYYWCLAENL